MSTRAEHLEWCKQRAREYIAAGDYLQAATSMLSDLSKHPETERSGGGVCAMLMLTVHDRESASRFVEGFN